MTQKEALDILKTGRNVFLTGAAGSGKTHTLREYITYLKELNAEVAITASTGIAATHMGGMTIHSWSGLGIRDYLTDGDLDEIADKSHIRGRMRDAKVLIIDEISMLDGTRLGLLDMVLKRVRNSAEPFGGVQTILCGDFFQLPPINKSYRGQRNESMDFDGYGGNESNSTFAFNSPAWRELGLKVCYLEEQHRQEDGQYLQVLNAIRDNSVDQNTIDILNTRIGLSREALLAEWEPTKLYSHNVNVDGENEREIGSLSGKLFIYNMESRGARNLVESLKKSCLAPETLKLKQGAKVMFVKNNFEEGYVNGTLGVVDRLDEDRIVVRTLGGKIIDVPMESWRIEEDGRVKAEIVQFPLRLAWAITVHKSQGMSLDSAEIDLSNCFEPGMGYVALSRVRSLAGLSLKGINAMALKVSDEVLEFDDDLRQMSEDNRKKISKMGDESIKELQENFKIKIAGDEDGKPRRKKKLDTVQETKRLLEEEKTVKKIAEERGLTLGTVMDHIEKIKDLEPSFNIYHLRDSMPKAKFAKIYAGFQKIGVSDVGKRPLTPVKNLLGDKFTYEDLRLVRLFL